MVAKVKSYIKQHKFIIEYAKVIVAVSGGPYSMALLHFMHSLRSEWNLRLIALSVDHQLRGTESLEDLRYVESICNQWNIPFIGTSLDVPGYQQKKRLGTQVAA